MADNKANSDESQNVDVQIQESKPISISRSQKPVNIGAEEVVEIFVPNAPSLVTDGYDPKISTKETKNTK